MNPDITVVIPYHNEKKTIAYTLERVGEQTLPPKIAIFVNSSSTDDTFEYVQRWIEENQSRFKTEFRNVFEKTDNPASSKNVGIRHATTEWIAFMDCGQNFEKYWLESQYKFATKHNLDVVSGVVYLVGENWVDRCAVSQTYGYKRNRPCLPTTLVRKSIFEKTGLLLEGRRAGYDAAWPIKLNKLGIPRGINPEVIIKYIGFNFSSNLNHLYKKSILYSKPTVAIEGYPTPYLYIAFPLIVLLSFALSYKIALALILIYFLTRTFALPILKSRNILFYKEHPIESFFGLGLIGLVIDLGKMVGIMQGIRYYYFSKPNPTAH
jgi:glycosyltransferase involved in cell wall biosynthesis